MATCPKCQKSSPVGVYRFCGFCGTKLDDTEERVLLLTAKIPKDYRILDHGTWHVTTEGDVEGRSVNDLGIHTGSIIDIARKLSPYCYYTLRFNRGDITQRGKAVPPPLSGVHISLDIPTFMFEFSPKERREVMQKLFEENKLDPRLVQPGTYSGSVYIKFK